MNPAPVLATEASEPSTRQTEGAVHSARGAIGVDDRRRVVKLHKQKVSWRFVICPRRRKREARDISQSGVASDASSAIMERPRARGKRSLKREDETLLALVPTNNRFNSVRWYNSTLDGYYLPVCILNCPFQLRTRKGAALR